jgi:hypothetical protein
VAYTTSAENAPLAARWEVAGDAADDATDGPSAAGEAGALAEADGDGFARRWKILPMSTPLLPSGVGAALGGAASSEASARPAWWTIASCKVSAWAAASTYVAASVVEL